MRALDDIRDKLWKEMEEIARKGELSAGDLEVVHKLTDTIKNIDKIECIEENGYSSRGYSRGNWNASGTYGNGYDRGDSYARRGMHYVRGHYSRDDGREMIMNKMQEMIDGGGMSASDRNALEKAMRIMEMQKTASV